MKSRLIHIMIFCVAVFLFSCEDYLDLQEEATYTDVSYYNTEERANKILTACYDIFHAGWPINFWDVHHTLGDMRSDDAFMGGNPDGSEQVEREQVTINDLSPDNPNIDDYWEFYYAGIWRANQAIEKIEAIEDEKFSSVDVKKRMIAEAKFLRAYHYSFLVKNWGAVPLVDHVLSPEEYKMAKSTEEEVFKFIKDELRSIIPDLPLNDGTDIGRAKRGTAMYLLTNVLVFEAGTDAGHPNWQEAFELSNTLIRGEYAGEYKLLQNYNEIWMEGNDFNEETIFEVVYIGETSESNSFVTYTYPRFVTLPDGSRGGGWGWGLNCPTQDLADEFETTDNWEDPRLQYSIWREGDIVPLGTSKDPENDSLPVWLDDTPTGYYMKKYWLNKQPGGFGAEINAKIFRYSDLILYNAEAAYYTNKEDIARESLNLVRERARQGNPDVLPDVTASGQELLQAIWHERRVELCGEAVRFYDIKRQGKLKESFEKVGKYFTENQNEYLPIPRGDIDLNPNLEQNPNY